MDYAIVARHPGKAEVLEQRPIQIPSPKMVRLSFGKRQLD